MPPDRGYFVVSPVFLCITKDNAMGNLRQSQRMALAALALSAIWGLSCARSGVTGMATGGAEDQREQAAVTKKPADLWVGKQAAAFTLPDSDGALVDIGQDLGRRPVVLIFYRGVW